MKRTHALKQRIGMITDEGLPLLPKTVATQSSQRVYARIAAMRHWTHQIHAEPVRTERTKDEECAEPGSLG